jgi:hypothetical protein
MHNTMYFVSFTQEKSTEDMLEPGKKSFLKRGQ